MQANLPVASVLPLILALGTAGCASTPLLTPSELNAQQDLYDGKDVRVRGWLQDQFEDIGLWDSKKSRDESHSGRDVSATQKIEGTSLVWPKACISLIGESVEEAHRYSGPAIVSGTFRRHIYPPDVISNGVCNDTGLEVSTIREMSHD